MDTVPGVPGWWWLDENRHWRWTRSRLVALVRARRARRLEIVVRLAERGIVGGKWR